MKNVCKVITGNEHGGASMSSELLIDGLYQSQDVLLMIICLCNGEFAKKLKNKYNNSVIILQDKEPPIIGNKNLIIRSYNYSRLILWFIKVCILFEKVYLKKTFKNIHTTNNYALLVCCVCGLFNSYNLITHWRCVGGFSPIIDLLIKRVNVFICISNAVKFSFPSNLQGKCKVIYNGLEINKLERGGDLSKGKLRNYLKICDKKSIFGTIGTFSDIKCHNLLIETCRLLNKQGYRDLYHCVLIGSTPNEYCKQYLQYLKNKVDEYNLKENISFVFDYEIDKPSYIISDFDFFVGSTWFGGRGEGFGLVYVEAMAQALPLIAIAVGAAKELITSEIGILTKTNSPEELEKVIVKFFESPDLLNKMSIQSRKKASLFDIKNTINSCINIYV